MKPITIDNLDIKDHVRWANDQNHLDSVYLTEAQAIAHLPEMLGTSAIYTSQWETLFEWQKRNAHWASFAPPSKYHLASKRLFSFRLFPTIYWKEEEEEGTEDDQPSAEEFVEKKDKESPAVNLVKEVINTAAFFHQPSIVFEKDKTTILNLLESIKYLDGLLAQITGKTMQYQKG